MLTAFIPNVNRYYWCLPVVLLLLGAVVYSQVRPSAARDVVRAEERGTPEEENRPTEEQRQEDFKVEHFSIRAKRHLRALFGSSALSQRVYKTQTSQPVRIAGARSEYEYRNGTGAHLRC